MFFSSHPLTIFMPADSLNLRSAAERRVFIKQMSRGAVHAPTLFGVTVANRRDAFGVLQITRKQDANLCQFRHHSTTIKGPPALSPHQPTPSSQLSVHLVTQRSPSQPGRDHMTPPPPFHLLRPAAAALAQQKQHRLPRPRCDFGRHSGASPRPQGHVTHFGM